MALIKKLMFKMNPVLDAKTQPTANIEQCLPANVFPHLSAFMVSFRGQKTVSVEQFGYHPRTHPQIFHNRKSHDLDSHERCGAKVKGVEETVGVEAGSAYSMG